MAPRPDDGRGGGPPERAHHAIAPPPDTYPAQGPPPASGTIEGGPPPSTGSQSPESSASSLDLAALGLVERLRVLSWATAERSLACLALPVALVSPWEIAAGARLAAGDHQLLHQNLLILLPCLRLPVLNISNLIISW